MTYKMTVAFKLNLADFPPLLNSNVSKPFSSVFSLLSYTTIARSFPNKVSTRSFKSHTKASNKPFPSATRFSPGNFALSIYTIFPSGSYLILLVTFQLNSNITLFANLSYRFNPSLLM